MKNPKSSFLLHDWLIKSNAPDSVWTAYYDILQSASVKRIKIINLDEEPASGKQQSLPNY